MGAKENYYVEARIVYLVVESKYSVVVATCALEKEADYLKECMEKVEVDTPKPEDMI